MVVLVAIGAAFVVTGRVGVVGPFAFITVGSVVPLKGTMFATNPAGRGVFVAVQQVVMKAPAFLALCILWVVVPSFHASYGSEGKKIVFEKKGEDVGFVFKGK